MLRVFLKIISIYRKYFSFDRGLLAFLAPGGACRYSLTCSEYTEQVISKYGLVKGFVLGLKRLMSCR